MTQKLMNQNQRKLKLLELARVSPEFGSFLSDHPVRKVYHVDEKVAIFEPSTLPQGKVLKFVISPPNGNGKKVPLTPDLENIVRRGASNQYLLQDVEGVQRLGSPGFYNGVSGLIGPFDYIEGVNLGHKKFRELIRQFGYGFAVDIIKKTDEILKNVHDRYILQLDIKPGNIICSRRDLKFVVDIIDWSLSSTFYQAENDLQSSSFMATPNYSNKPQALERKYSRDYFSLAWTLANCLLNVKPEDLGFDNSLDFFRAQDLDDASLWVYDKLKHSFSENVGDYFLELLGRPLEYDKGDSRWSLPDPRIQLPVRVTPRDFVPKGNETCDLSKL